MDAPEASLRTLPIRLHPGEDLRRSIEKAVASEGVSAAFVLSGIGSLRPARVRLAGAAHSMAIDSDCELLTLSGSVGVAGSHLHLSVADAQGRVVGGHCDHGCIVRTTAELLLVLLPGWQFTREPDPRTGWAELVLRREAGA